MPLLTRIRGPRDLDRLSLEQLDQLAEEIRTFLVDAVSKTGGHLGPNLGVVELTIALHRVFDSPEGQGPLGHRPPVLRPQAAHRPSGLLQAEDARAACPATPRRPSPSTTSSRTATPPRCSAGPTASPRPTRCSKQRRPRGRGHRRRRAHRRHGLGGAQQHRRRQGPPAGHRRQRQRALLRARPSAASPTTWPPCAPPTATSASWPAARTSWSAPRSSARPLYETLHGAKKGLKDFIAPQGMFEDLGLKYVGPIDGHDIEALESALRPRQALRRPGHRALPHREGPRLPARPPGRGGPLPRRRQDPPATRACRSPPPAPTGPPSSARRWSSSARSARTSSPSRPPCSSRSASTSSPRRFPDRVYDVGIAEQHARRLRGRPRHRRAAPGLRRLRDLPQPRLRPGPDGRRPAQVRCHLRPGPGRRHRHRRRLAQRHVGHVDPPGRAGPAARRAARRRPGPRPAARGRRRRRRADRGPLLQGRGRPGRPAVGRIGGMDVLREPRHRRPGRAAGLRRRPRADVPGDRRPARQAGHLHAPSSTRAGSSPSTRPWPRSPSSTAWSSPSRTTRRVGGVGSAVAQALRDAGRRRAAARLRHPAALPRPRLPRRGPGRDRADRAGHRPPGHRPGLQARRPVRAHRRGAVDSRWEPARD